MAPADRLQDAAASHPLGSAADRGNAASISFSLKQVWNLGAEMTEDREETLKILLEFYEHLDPVHRRPRPVSLADNINVPHHSVLNLCNSITSKAKTMNPDTLWMIYSYQQYMAEARGHSVKTIDARLRHIHMFAETISEKSLKALKPDDIVRFKKMFPETVSEHDDATALSPATIVQTLNDLKAFLVWLREQPGYSGLQPNLADYSSPSRRLAALARVPTSKYVPSPDEIRRTLSNMPDHTFKQRRDRAVIASLFLTGVRDGALVSLRMKHVDLENRQVFQDAREVKTKFSKTMTTIWFPVGEDIEKIVVAWIEERLRAGVSEDAPLFPSLRHTVEGLGASVRETFWNSTGPVRKIVRQATLAADVPYFRPHAIRATLAVAFYDLAQTMEEQKALSQNLGHEDLATTLQHYGKIDESRQHELIRDMWTRKANTEAQRLTEKLDRLPPDKRNLIEQMIDVFDPSPAIGR
jgi:integrase